MALQRARATVNSITFRLVLVIYAILVPIIVLLIYINNQTRDTLLAQVESTRQNMLQSYMQRVDSSLQGAFTYTNGLATQSNDTKVAAYAGDETAVAYAKVRIGNALQDRAGSSDLVDGYFALLQTYQGPSFLHSTHSTADAADKQRIRAFVEENLAAWSARDIYWQLCSLEGADYLLLVTSDGEGIYTGMYINLARMVQRLAGSGGEALLYAPDAGAPAGTRLLLAPSGIAPLTLGYLLDEGEVLASLPFMQRYTPLVTLSLLMLIPAVFLLLRQIVTKPMGRLTAAMRRVQRGDLDTRLPPAANASTEMRILSDTFNHMLERIQHLKISVYEKELAGQKAQLRNLQLQIRPHFLINSLNMVYNEMEGGETAVAKALILHTVDYFRYMVRIDDELVPLEEELRHVRAYLEIQRIRYPDKLAYTIEVDPAAQEVLVPPLAVQTFVENGIKYAIDENRPLQFAIRADALPENRVLLAVADNGCGYPAPVLETLAQGGRIVDGRGEHIGIRNLVRRCTLLFGSGATCRFYNRQGAVAELTLPATFL